MKILSNLFLLFILFYAGLCNGDAETEDSTDAAATTIEPAEELSFGCPPPSIRYSRIRKTDTTETILKYETTQLYLPEDMGSENFDIGGHLDMDAIGGPSDTKSQLHSSNTNNNDNNKNYDRRTRYTDLNQYLWDDQIKNLRSSYNHSMSKNDTTQSSGMARTKRDSMTAASNRRSKDQLQKNLNDNLKGDAGKNEFLSRHKRKSGKTTGALSRPKADTGSSKASQSSRKIQSGNFDEDSGGMPHPDEDTSSSESHEEDHDTSSEETNFREVNEVRFPGEIGPMGDRRLCKIKCIKGKWIGPLCATDEDGSGIMNFQPLYKSCFIDRISAYLLLSYKNVSVSLGWVLPHGHFLQARCTELGMYKLLGESRVLCSNGLWTPRMPSCVPTTLLTNNSDDSPPSVKIKIGTGSGAVEPSGVLAILPSSTVYLDCIYPRRRGTPEWTWTGWFRHYSTGWSALPEEKATKFRLTIKDIQIADSGTFTCASPRGLTNSIVIVVTNSQCPPVPDAQHPLALQLEGTKLGQKAMYTCPLGYILKGTENSTCLASGNWSSPPPTCHPVQCPKLELEDPHLSLVELNASAWGRAVFSCSWGYKLSGPPGVECEPAGVWSGPVPRCRAIQCPQPLVPINGRIDGASSVATITGHRRYAVGALVTFSCTDGHILEGEASIVCTETGFWSHPPPFCKSQCPYPGDPPNGLIAPLKFQYDPGDTLSVQCRPGFVEYSLSGTVQPERPKCLPDGDWSAPVPQCKNYEEV